ncbi:hypothetical protein OG923_34050 (plasmid) [Streptomyces halstedii]|uniref:hypothetical protein n=1 Tax=Streptomyces halstedii TaxID=1944 RepID=UPI002F914986
MNDDARRRRSRLPAFLRRLEPPRTLDGQPDYRPPAAVLATCIALVVMFAAFYMALYSRLFHHHPHLAAAAVTVAAMLPALAVYAIAHRLLARFGLYLWQSVLVGVVLLAVMAAAPDWARTVFPRAYDRYAAELGGPGKCLYATPYNLDRARSTFAADHLGRMIINPVDDGPAPLRLDHAVDGGVKHLTPADPTARRILAQYGC